MKPIVKSTVKSTVKSIAKAIIDAIAAIVIAVVTLVNIVAVIVFRTALWPAVGAFFMSLITPYFLESADIQTSANFGFWPFFWAFWGLFVIVRLLKKA